MRTLRFVTSLCCALVSGLTLSHVLQGPGSRGLDGPAWLQVQQTFYGGFAVVGGICEIVGLLAAVIVAVRLRRTEPVHAAAHLLAAVCLLGTLAAYVFGNRPVNDRIAGWTAAALPPDWPQYRDQWGTAHAISAGLSGIALLVLLVVVIWVPVGAGSTWTSRPSVRAAA